MEASDTTTRKNLAIDALITFILMTILLVLLVKGIGEMAYRMKEEGKTCESLIIISMVFTPFFTAIYVEYLRLAKRVQELITDVLDEWQEQRQKKAKKNYGINRKQRGATRW